LTQVERSDFLYKLVLVSSKLSLRVRGLFNIPGLANQGGPRHNW